MSSHHHDTPVIDRKTLRAAAFLIALSLVGAAYGRFTGNATVMDDRSGVTEVVQLHFEDRSDGAVLVREGQHLIAVFEAGEGAFLRGALRALVRSRQLGGEGSEVPFELVLWKDGRLSLEDPVTDQNIVLNAFGPDNVRPFTDLLSASRALQTDKASRRLENEA
jgi:putative photosynthetic complex assembly protein